MSQVNLDGGVQPYVPVSSSQNYSKDSVHQRLECVALSLEDREENDSPPLHSVFLCPSNISALLETATSMSLGTSSGAKIINRCVGGNESASDGGDDCVTLRGDSCSVRAQIFSSTEHFKTLAEFLGTVRGGQKVTTSGPSHNSHNLYKDEQRESQTLEIHLPLDDYQGDTNIHDPRLPQLAPPIPVDALLEHVTPVQPTVQVHQPHSPLPSSLLYSPTRTRGESSQPHTSPTHTEHTIMCSQLSIPMDQIDEEEGACPGGMTSSHPYITPHSQRSSMASSMSSVPPNEGDVPFNFYRRDSYQTHSRNVSETPSMPPYHCSSTSSAYHSRNSSFGSQFSSSCFESDSLLTDIDSCLAVQMGSHGDIKHPIRLQDSRFTRLGDSSPMSYSSEWSLHHHMNRPIGLSEQLINHPPPNIEDTLRNMSLESLEERKKLATMKSSEWIKRQFSKYRESLVQVKVSSKTKHVVHFNVRAGDVIIWEFATKKKDIAFGVLFEATQVATQQPEEEEEEKQMEDKILSILPMFRVNTHARPVVGTHTAAQDGVYEIVFDNTYSRFFAKELYYRITTQPSIPNVNYLKQ